MTKKELRKVYKSKRAELSAQQRMKLDDLMLIQFQKLSLPFLQTVLSFYPLEEKGEVDTFIFTDYLQFTNPGLVVAYPKTNLEACTMQAIATTSETEFQENAWGIPEPAADDIIEPHLIDAVLVPMLAFDERGNRVGYGKGFYDRFLQHCRADCITIGLCYFDPVPQIEDAGEYDVTLNYCITPQRVYVF
jgi:5-formyltetrahydrofolate cyclo-ligase